MWKKIILLLILISTPILFSGCENQLDKRRFAGLQVKTNDIAASVYINDEYLSDAPFLRKNLKPGNYNLKIVPQDPKYVPYELPIKLSRGLLAAVIWTPGDRVETSGGVVYELEKISNLQLTEITVSSIPDGAIVRINDGEMEFTPTLRSELIPGKHDVHISLPSYTQQHHTLNLVAGHRLNVFFKLARSQDALEANLGDFNSDSQSDLNTNSQGEASSATASGTVNSDSNSDSDSNSNSQSSPASTTNPNPAPTPNPSPVPIRTAVPTTLNPADSNKLQSVKINNTGFFSNSLEVLRVRSGPGLNFSEVGFATVGKLYPYLNETKSGWFKIQIDSQEGWVSETYATLE
jgi:hypothetical protein